ncbi:MAG: hypothetical protein JO252_27700 [Planctomycetaceae bacterium]|nr:hypothetical protein [Planctomycetaceae bacterium]
MSLLDHPEAQALLNDAILSPETVRGCADRLTGFFQRYLPKFYRIEQRENATTVIRGLLSGLERMTWEPIVIEAGLPRKPIQSFVVAGQWGGEGVMTELRLQWPKPNIHVMSRKVAEHPSREPPRAHPGCRQMFSIAVSFLSVFAVNNPAFSGVHAPFSGSLILNIRLHPGWALTRKHNRLSILPWYRQ